MNRFCNHTFGTALASVHSAADFNEIRSNNFLCNPTISGHNHCKIGLEDLDNDHSYQWIDGTSVDYTAWQPTEPNYFGGCVSTHSSGQWDAASDCDICGRPFVCNAPDINNNPVHIWSRYNNYIWVSKNEILFLSEMEQYCSQTFNGSLASIHTEEQNTEITQLCQTYSYYSCIIGLNDITIEGVYEWIDGSVVDYALSWNDNDPGDRCHGIRTDNGLIGDLLCSSVNHPFICNAPFQSDQVHIWSTNNLFIWVGPKAVDFYSANDYCLNNFGTNLASIHSDYESQEISDLCNTYSYQNCLIGLNDINYEGVYEWIDGSVVDYPINWKDGSPDNQCSECGGIEEDCCILYNGDDQKIGDAACNHPVQYFPFICNVPTPSPTDSPTTAPTEAPSPSTPTAQPTLTEKHVYVRQNGCDYGYCNYSSNSNDDFCINNSSLTQQYAYCCLTSPSPTIGVDITYQPTCKSIEYSWNCYLGIGGYGNNTICEQYYDANGVFDIGEGVWDFPYNLNYDDNNIIIRGQGRSVTTWRYTGNESIWITCRWKKCWLSFQDLTIASNRTAFNDIQFYMAHGGTLHIRNVVFDGNNYNVPHNGEPFWQFIDKRVNVEFYDCHFTNNDAMFLFSNGVNAYFENCTFAGNGITLNTGLNNYSAMFMIKESNIVFIDCLFVNNTQINRPLFSIQNRGNLSITNTRFIQNIDLTNKTNIFSISNSSILKICTSTFIMNTDYQNIIWSNYDSQIIINSSTFTNNNVNSIINSNNIYLWDNDQFECVSDANAHIYITSSIFNGNIVNYVLYNDGSNTYIDDDTMIIDNSCNQYCVHSMDGSLNINGNNMSSSSLVQFGHNSLNAPNNISLCIRNKNNVKYSSYLLLRNVSKNKAKIIYGECLPYTIGNYFIGFETISNNTQINIYDTPIDRSDKSLNCTHANISLCEMYCNSTAACDLATFIVNKPNTNIFCESFKSCEFTSIRTEMHDDLGYNNTSLHIICDKSLSCQSAQILINNIDEFKLDCIDGSSCIGVAVNLSNTITSQISCYRQGACDNLRIITDNDNTTVNLYQFSQNVVINNSVGYTTRNLKCGHDDASILLNNQHNTTTDSILGTLYNPMPCSDVTFICNSTESCAIDEYVSSINLGQNFTNTFFCYGPENYQSIVQIECIGTCPESPTLTPTSSPTLSTTHPSAAPTQPPSISPSHSPTSPPSRSPSLSPSVIPSSAPSLAPSIAPSIPPTFTPSVAPSDFPTLSPSQNPTGTPTLNPSSAPSITPSTAPTNIPSVAPSQHPSLTPSHYPSINPSIAPTLTPTVPPSFTPSAPPSKVPSSSPSLPPSAVPSFTPTAAPSVVPSVPPSVAPSTAPTFAPSTAPTLSPSIFPTAAPSIFPTAAPSIFPTAAPSITPTIAPTFSPSIVPSNAPSLTPSLTPTNSPLTCPDLRENYATIDGVDLILDPADYIEYVVLGNDSDLILASQFVNKYHNCTNEDGCDYYCESITSCFQYTIDCNTPTGCNIICQNSFSCLSMKIIADSYDSTELTIICHGQNSCQDMFTDIVGITSAHIHCESRFSCFSLSAQFDEISSRNNSKTSVTCYSDNACDFLHVYADGPYTQLNMYSHSGDVILDNGHGYLSEINTITCGLDQSFIKYPLNNIHSIKQLVEAEYAPNLLPCEDITVICDLNKTGIENDEYCSMKYIYSDINSNDPIFNGLSCVYAALYDVVKLQCEGNCLSSPSLAPTIAPSNSPVISPTNAPSTSPSTNPTTNPVAEPSSSPSKLPSAAPTFAPSSVPSSNPTETPSKNPSATPSTSPSYSPSKTPSISPTAVPSNYPSNAPTANPTFSPFKAPTSSPTETPSDTPSTPPTVSPSHSPTIAPTHNPISDNDFDSIIKIKYLLEELQRENIIKLILNKYNVTHFIENKIKNAYFDQQYLEYKELMVNIDKIEGEAINKIDEATGIKWNDYDTLRLDTIVECDKKPIDRCSFIKSQSQKNAGFINITQSELRQYFNNNNLLFSVVNPNALKIECKYCDSDQFDFTLIILGSIVGLIILISLFAFLFNKGAFPKLPGFNIVDDARWTALISFALQFYDFGSDLNLSIEMWTRNDIFDDFIILTAAIGCSVFLLIPYIAN
eukprot:267750_1